MNRKLLFFSLALTFAFVSARAACLQAEVPSASLLDSLDEGDYDHAVQAFDEVVKMHGRKADAALYWKAYALNKAGNKAQALTTVTELRKGFPRSNYLRDAGVLEQQIHSSTGQPPNPENVSDEELKLLALESLMNSEPERAVPLLDKVINGNGSPKLKDKVLFVLSQSGSEKAQQILLALAKGNTQPDLQKRAIRYMGMNGNGRNRAVLKEIYNSSSDVGVKKSVFQAWLMSGDKESVLAVARTEKSPELRRDAIRHLGMMGGRAELRDMYKNSGDAETREAVVEGMLMCGDSQGLVEIANGEKDPRVADRAIRTLGMVGGRDSLTALTNIYNSRTEIETRKSVINALFLHGAGKEMVALARKETNPELKKALVQKMSLMGSPEITEYMMEILNK
jgi:HEAT repeat protein